MIYNENGYRYKNYTHWEDTRHTPYDYEKNGLLKHIMSNRIVNSKNEILFIIKLYFEKSIVFLLKYVDKLKHFKNYHWKNR